MAAGSVLSDPAVVAVERPPTSLHIATATASVPPPTVVMNSPGGLGIPVVALSAYRNAEQMMAASYPGCGVSWNLLPGIGRIESMLANGGATDARGTAIRPIYGPALDGTLPGNEVVVESSVGTRVSYARAMGPMQSSRHLGAVRLRRRRRRRRGGRPAEPLRFQLASAWECIRRTSRGCSDGSSSTFQQPGLTCRRGSLSATLFPHAGTVYG